MIRPMQVMNELGYSPRVLVWARNRSGATVVAGDVVIPDWDNDSGDVSGTRVDGELGPTGNVTDIANGVASQRSNVAMVCVSTSVPDNEMGRFCVYGEVDAYVYNTLAATEALRGGRIALEAAAGNAFTVSGNATRQAKGVLLENTGTFAGAGIANKVKKRVFLHNDGMGMGSA